MSANESQIEKDLIQKLTDLKYTYRPEIGNRLSLEANFRQKFETLNRVHLTDADSLACATRLSPLMSSRLHRPYGKKAIKLLSVATSIVSHAIFPSKMLHFKFEHAMSFD